MHPCKYALHLAALALCLAASFAALAQAAPFKRNVVYAEAEQVKPFYSINYEHIFAVGAVVKYSYRAGLAFGHNSVYTPLGLSAFTGNKAHHLTVDFTVAPYNVKYTKEQRGSDHLWDTYLYVFPALGYRYQAPGGRLFLRLSASPGFMLDVPSKHLLEVQPDFTPAVFAAFGYAF